CAPSSPVWPKNCRKHGELSTPCVAPSGGVGYICCGNQSRIGWRGGRMDWARVAKSLRVKLRQSACAHFFDRTRQRRHKERTSRRPGRAHYPAHVVAPECSGVPWLRVVATFAGDEAPEIVVPDIFVANVK